MNLAEDPSVVNTWLAAEGEQLAAEQVDQARQALDPKAVLSELQSLLLGLDDEDNPLYRLVEHCTRVGTEAETGVRPYMAASVGEKLRPYVERAITRLTREALLLEVSDGEF